VAVISGGEPMKTRKALVIDDDPLCRNLLADILREKNFEVSPYRTPHEFFADHPRCRAQDQACYAVIISDNRMPGMSGIDFLHTLKAEFKCPLPVHHMALISGDWQQQDLNRATKLGCRIFDKPTPIDTLFAWLDDLFCS